jgi:large subunit ribosomal protein L24
MISKKCRVSKKYRVGDVIFLTNGLTDFRGKTFSIKKIEGEILYLDGYKTVKRAMKITQNNTENYKIVDVPVHISNISGYDPIARVPSKIGFRILEDGSKERFYKKTSNKC